jgi:SAM-dependent methyltransferase
LDEKSMTPYSKNFYAVQQSGSLASADVVVPVVLSLFHVKSVVDVGCGVGGWLKVFERHGVSDYLGVDGDYVPRTLLKIPDDRFRATDITGLLDFGRSFDLACSLEVGEHLPARAAEQFVAGLVRAAPVVLFSAAIPRQGGTAHINEQWPTYWAALFARHGYIPVDCVRPLIYSDKRVDWWYRQNILIFCRSDKRPNGYEQATSEYELNRIHPEMIENLLTPGSGTQALNDILRPLPYLWRAVFRKIGLKDASLRNNTEA